MRCNSINTTIYDNNNRINNDHDHDLVYYGVVYVSVYAYYVVQLLLYDIQRSIRVDSINTTNCENGTTGSIRGDNINTTWCDNGTAKFTIRYNGCALHLYEVPILYYDIQYLIGCNNINTTNCDCDNGIAEFPIVYHRCSLYLYILPILYYDIQYLMGYNTINNTNCSNNNLSFLPIILEKKEMIDNTSKIDVDDNNLVSKVIFIKVK